MTYTESVEDVEFISDDELGQSKPNHRVILREFAAKLVERTGEWARYPGQQGSAGTTAWRINHFDNGTLPSSQFQARVVDHVLYVRHYPEERR